MLVRIIREVSCNIYCKINYVKEQGLVQRIHDFVSSVCTILTACFGKQVHFSFRWTERLLHNGEQLPGFEVAVFGFELRQYIFLLCNEYIKLLGMVVVPNTVHYHLPMQIFDIAQQ